MSDYVTRCKLDYNGKTFEDFTSFSENSVALSKPVALMNKSGTAKLTPRYGFSVNVVENANFNGVNPRAIYGGTFTVTKDNGDTIRFGGVATTDTGDGEINGESEAAGTVTYSAESRIPALDLR